MQLYTWSTPNGRKVSIALEEMGLNYETFAIDIGKGDQHSPDFLSLNINHKIPTLVDGDQVINESGAILLYLAAKTGQFAPDYGTAEHWTMVEWVMWQMGGLGPMLGQAHHFLHFNPGKSDYAEARFKSEAERLYGVLNKRLEGRAHVAGDLSVADFAIWPWVSRFEYQKIDLNAYPNVAEWYARLAARPAFQRGYAVPVDAGPIPMP
ncbi:glutathione S-transferase family protein [Shimia ponticola]|uniref:glutathione S-transferase family protein n=1 Tax=Shimia ponticola TaxID=2582893 RepID=UPI0011BEC0B9|nr:glutathione S-transferase N-terminal domain-containing protein [Shimia ponticola]